MSPLALSSRTCTRIVFSPPIAGSSESAKANVLVGGVPLPVAEACLLVPSTKNSKYGVIPEKFLAVAVNVILSDSVPAVE